GGIGGGELALTEDLPEGEYCLMVQETVVSGKESGVRVATRRLRIERDDQPRLIVENKTYKPGDTVTALFRGRRTGNAPAAPNQPVIVKATNNDQPVPSDGMDGGKAQTYLQLQCDDKGDARFHFALPKDLKPGQLLMEAQVPDGKLNDTVQQTIPVGPPSTATVSMFTAEFFPEGGDLVAGGPNRVYFR